jgi:hypothetical protein
MLLERSLFTGILAKTAPAMRVQRPVHNRCHHHDELRALINRRRGQAPGDLGVGAWALLSRSRSTIGGLRR